jgi:hypothetical protein
VGPSVGVTKSRMTRNSDGGNSPDAANAPPASDTPNVAGLSLTKSATTWAAVRADRRVRYAVVERMNVGVPSTGSKSAATLGVISPIWATSCSRAHAAGEPGSGGWAKTAGATNAGRISRPATSDQRPATSDQRTCECAHVESPRCVTNKVPDRAQAVKHNPVPLR